jgi:hypothetical protein
VARASKVERQARALCGELARVTGGRPVQWRMLHEIEERLGFDEKATAAALLAALERGWIQAIRCCVGRPPYHLIRDRLCFSAQSRGAFLT